MELEGGGGPAAAAFHYLILALQLPHLDPFLIPNLASPHPTPLITSFPHLIHCIIPAIPAIPALPSIHPPVHG